MAAMKETASFASHHYAEKAESVGALRLRARVREVLAEQIEQAQVLYDEHVERILPEQGDMFPEPHQIAVVKADIERTVELPAGKCRFDAEREVADSNYMRRLHRSYRHTEVFRGTGERQAVHPSNRHCLRFGFLSFVSVAFGGTALLERSVKVIGKKH